MAAGVQERLGLFVRVYGCAAVSGDSSVSSKACPVKRAEFSSLDQRIACRTLTPCTLSLHLFSVSVSSCNPLSSANNTQTTTHTPRPTAQLQDAGCLIRISPSIRVLPQGHPSPPSAQLAVCTDRPDGANHTAEPKVQWQHHVGAQLTGSMRSSLRPREWRKV